MLRWRYWGRVMDIRSVRTRRNARRLLCEEIKKYRGAGYSNRDLRHLINVNHPFLWEMANTLKHWPVPVKMSRKEVNEAEARILLEEEEHRRE